MSLDPPPGPIEFVTQTRVGNYYNYYINKKFNSFPAAELDAIHVQGTKRTIDNIRPYCVGGLDDYYAPSIVAGHDVVW